MVIPGMPLPALLALLFATGLISPLYQGVRSAVLPQVLPPGPRYVLGRALMRMMAQSAQIVGYGVGGLLLAVLSPRGALAADALSFAASGLVLRFGISARPGTCHVAAVRWPATPWPGCGRCSPTLRPGGSCCSAGLSPRAWSRPRPWPPPMPPTSASPPGPWASC